MGFVKRISMNMSLMLSKTKLIIPFTVTDELSVIGRMPIGLFVSYML
jgi:hypothetical protein